MNAFHINSDTITNYIHLAIESPKVIIDYQTFYIHNLTEDNETKFNSLIFQMDGSCYKSIETPSQIMKPFESFYTLFCDGLSNFDEITNMDFYYLCLIGNNLFIPTYNNEEDETNWIALHHILYYKMNAGYIFVKFTDSHDLTLHLNIYTISSVVKKMNDYEKMSHLIVEYFMKNLKLTNAFTQFYLSAQKNKQSPEG